MENKHLVCKLLLPVLNITLEGRYLIYLVYDEGLDTVILKFRDGSMKVCDVKNLSCLKMIVSIVDKLI